MTPPDQSETPDQSATPGRVAPGDRDKAEGDRETVSPDVERASRVKESREANRQDMRAPAPARPHDPPTPDQAE
jgi:hypothetical protein